MLTEQQLTNDIFSGTQSGFYTLQVDWVISDSRQKTVINCNYLSISERTHSLIRLPLSGVIWQQTPVLITFSLSNTAIGQ